jgi:carboxymethylenebutenolidase
LREGQEIEIPTGSAPASGYLARPASGCGPGLLVLHEAAGLDDSLRDVCDRLARAGFAVLAPDLYGGRRAASRDEALRLAGALEAEAVARQLEDAATWLLGEACVEGTRVGVVGFCLGGHLALLAGSLGARAGAVVDFYGLEPGGPDGRLPVGLAELRGPVLGIFAAADEFVPAERVEELRGALAAAGVRAHLRVEPGVGHGFMNPARPERFDAHAASASWDRMLAFLRAELP